MQTWCTTDEVAALVKGTPTMGMLQQYAEEATSLLFELSGSCFAGQGSVQVVHQVNRTGHIKLNDWQPVRSVTSLTIDDVAVPFSLSPAGTYVSVDMYQYRNAFATLVLEVGQDPPTSGRRAAAELAAELLRGDPQYAATAGADDVRPPFRVTSIARQGVTYTYSNLNDSTKESLTGLYDVDLFLRAVNPNNTRAQPKVVPT